MDQIIPGLWIGDLACALATDYLSLAGITHVVTAMKQSLPTPIKLPDGRVIDEKHVFNVNLDDIESAPILVHLPGAVDFIDRALRQEWLEDDEGDGEARSDARAAGGGAAEEDTTTEPDASGTAREAEDEAGSRVAPPPGKGKGQWATMGDGTVFVHCHAGISRSVAIVCAYLMHTRRMSVQGALALIRARRAIADPNSGFVQQLELYESAGFEVDVRNQRVRRFLMSQASILRGDPIDDIMLSYYPSPLHSPAGSVASNGTFPAGINGFTALSSSDGVDGTSSPESGSSGVVHEQRRRRRRRSSAPSLESKANSADGAIGENASIAKSRQNSRAAISSTAAQGGMERHRASALEDRSSGEDDENGQRSSRSSISRARTGVFASPSDLSKPPPLGSNARGFFDEPDDPREQDRVTCDLIRDTFTSVSDPHEVMVTVSQGNLPGGVRSVRGNQSRVSPNIPRRSAATTAQALTQHKLPRPHFGAQKLRCKRCRRELAARDHVVEHDPGKGKDAFDVRKREKDAEQKSRDNRAALGASESGRSKDMEVKFGSMARPDVSTPAEEKTSAELKRTSTADSSGPVDNAVQSRDAPHSLSIEGQNGHAQPPYRSAANLSASLPPHLAALRLGRGQTQQASNGSSSGPGERPEKAEADGTSDGAADLTPRQPTAPCREDNTDEQPSSTQVLRNMLHSPQCSSYFVEPLAWMSALQNGEVAGRLDCPSSRCGSKLGSWDWAGMQCACGAWVTPAFALHRSKVDAV